MRSAIVYRVLCLLHGRKLERISATGEVGTKTPTGGSRSKVLSVGMGGRQMSRMSCLRGILMSILHIIPARRVGDIEIQCIHIPLVARAY